jgi:Zn-dependent protease
MTLDPIKHMGVYGLVVFAAAGYTWGAMPVNVSNLRRKHDDALVSIAGPLTNAALAIFCLVCLGLSSKLLAGDVRDYARIVFLLGLSQNILQAIFNMFPIPPLDGSRVLASFIPGMQDLVYSQVGNVVGLIFVFTFAGQIVWPMHDWVMGHAMHLLQLLGCY